MKQLLAVAALIFAGFTSTASAALLNASDYFNNLINQGTTVQNSNNTWQLGFVNNAGDFSLFDYNVSGIVVGSGQQASFDSFGSTYLGFGVNVSGTNAAYFGDAIASDELYAHPGNGVPNLVLRYRAAASGLFEFDTSVRNAHTGLVRISVLKGNAELNSTQIQKNNPALSSSTTFSQQLSLIAGETVDFLIDDFNGYGADGIAINANAGSVQVSEPGTLAILSLTLLALLRKRLKN